MKLRLIVLLFVSCVVVVAKEPNPADYTTTAQVTAAQLGSVQTGTNTPSKPANCENPQTSFDKGFCAAYESHSTTQYSHYADVTAAIGETVYTLRGPSLLPPGAYQVRFEQGRRHAAAVEFLLHDKKGKPKAVKYYIMGLAAAPKQEPQKQEPVNPSSGLSRFAEILIP